MKLDTLREKSSIALLRLLPQGEGFICYCGGMLGRERPGILDWGHYRRCLACGKNVNHHYYE